ncbi:sugar phosphate nucleotidyltransferase [Hamadaea tsunoensis]|uniref:sugar phosphate nucleotidyltransferase n=1 Tax=Hamadaea tsunoensis TaxID=53368 RepID=UPI00040256AA|nr:sugar phosphate nucleotidyltransferase [Hamadaea tsunoensis]
MTDDVRAVLLAGGEGRRMGPLGTGRSKPLIPFGGSCRLVDFSLANARDSGLGDVLLLSQFAEKQLMDDLRRTWWRPDFRVHFGPFDTAYWAGVPEHLDPPEGPPERGTADALLRKAEFIFTPGVRDVLVLHADHVYRFDYRPLFARHRATGAALTLAYQRIEREYVRLFGMVEFDGQGRLTKFVEKPENPTSDLVFAAFCVFDAAKLEKYLGILDGRTGWQHDISRDVIPAMLAAGEHIEGYPVDGPWADIGTVERYHRAHLQSVRQDPAAVPVAAMPRTIRPGVDRRLVQDAPGIRHSVVPADAAVRGDVAYSVLFPGAVVHAGAVVTDSVVLPGAIVPPGAHVDGAIVLESGEVQAVVHG